MRNCCGTCGATENASTTAVILSGDRLVRWLAACPAGASGLTDLPADPAVYIAAPLHQGCARLKKYRLQQARSALGTLETDDGGRDAGGS